MKIESIVADNFLRLNLLELDLSGATAHIIAGRNEAGKSSIQEAVRFALLGETVRVSKKGDYKLMIREGAKAGSVAVTVDGETIARDVKTGKQADEDHPYHPHEYLPFLLDAQRFAKENPEKRRSFLLELTDTSVRGEDVARRMRAKGVSEQCIEDVLPMLRAGFDAAHKEAKNRASEYRSQWVGLTGNARYGSQIAENWEAQPPDNYDPDELERLATDLGCIVEKISNLQAKKGALNHLLAQAKEQKPVTCCECGAKIRVSWERSVETGKTEPKCTPYTPVPEEEIGQMQASLMAVSSDIDRLMGEQGDLNAKVLSLQTKKALMENAAETTGRARAIHKLVQDWEKCASALAPDGIPAEILSDALKPVNDRLRATALATGWPQVTIDPDMTIRADGRQYGLLSESAKWRADAAIAEAIAYLSGLKLLILDRIDVLDIPNRGALVTWVSTLVTDYDTILLFGTLKQAPPSLPAGMAAHWIENGEVTVGQEAA